MAYSSFANHFIHFIYYISAFVSVYVILPRLIFRKHFRTGLDLIVSNYLKMVFLMILIGYILVTFKIWEMLALIPLFIFLILLRWRIEWRELHQSNHDKPMAATIYHWIENPVEFKEAAQQVIQKKKKYYMQKIINRVKKKNFWYQSIGFCVVFGISAYIRFTDTFLHPAPAMSDGYVTLAWMKYIDNRLLFEDGIYPQGSHIYLASLLKFSFLDGIYILKYTGPLNSLLIAGSLYYSVSRFTNHKIAGFLAASIYGIFGHLLLGGVWERQSATNSQEFAFIFILPALYFLFRYMQTGYKDDLWTATAGMSISGLVHTLAFALCGLGVMVMLSVYLFTRRRRFVHLVWRSCLYSAASIPIALAPLGLGYVTDKSLHSSSVNYLTGQLPDYPLEALNTEDVFSLAFIAVLVIWGLFGFSHRPHTMDREKVLFTGLFGLAVFIIDRYGAYLTQNELIATRSHELWALVFPFCIGIGFWFIFSGVRSSRWTVGFQAMLFTLFITLGVWYYPVQAIEPYKMQWDEDIEQYLHIKSRYQPREWMLVSMNEGYSVALNSGVHMLTKTFLENYDPSKPTISKFGEQGPDKNIPLDVYIYYHKEIFRVDLDNAIYNLQEPIYKDTERYMAALQEWIDRFRSSGGEATIYYDGPHLRIYHIHRELTKEERLNRIWG